MDLTPFIEKEGGQCWAYSADLTDEKSANDLVATVLKEHGGVDILISAPQKGWSGPSCCALVMLGARARAKIEWDSKDFKITNNEAANKFLHREYRQGWKL